MPGRRVHRLAQGRGAVGSNGARPFDDWTAARSNADLLYFFGDAQDQTSTSLDLSGNSQDMTLLGDTSTVPSRLAGVHGYDFGGDEYMQGGSTPAIVSTGSVTAEVEFELDTVTGTQTLIQRGATYLNANWNVRVAGDSIGLFFRNEADTSTREWAPTSHTLSIGTRYHLVFRHTFGNGTGTTVTVNGVDVPGRWNACGDDHPEVEAGWTHRLGYRSGATHIIECKIYSAAERARYATDAEVAALYTTAVAARNIK